MIWVDTENGAHGYCGLSRVVSISETAPRWYCVMCGENYVGHFAGLRRAKKISEMWSNSLRQIGKHPQKRKAVNVQDEDPL